MNSTEKIKSALRTWAKDDPLDAVVTALLGSGVAYYLAERDANPAVANPVEGVAQMLGAIWHGATVTPATPTGRAIVALVGAIGPTLALSVFDPPARASSAPAGDDDPIATRLDRIIALLERRG